MSLKLAEFILPYANVGGARGYKEIGVRGRHGSEVVGQAGTGGKRPQAEPERLTRVAIKTIYCTIIITKEYYNLSTVIGD